MSQEVVHPEIANRRLLLFRRLPIWVLAVLAVLSVLPSAALALQQPVILIAPDPEVLLRGDAEAEMLSAEQLSELAARLEYENFRDFYFFKKLVQLDIEMLLREHYLYGLFRGINQELKKRDPTSRFFELGVYDDPPEDYGLDPRDEFADTTSFMDEYKKVNAYVRAEYHHKLILAEALKAKLVQEGALNEVHRMFEYDLELAYDAYELGVDGFYDEDLEDRLLGFPLAILRLNHILELYPYSNLDDVLFYRGEAEYGARYYLTAAQTFEELLALYPGSPYYVDGLARLFYLYDQTNQYDAIAALWREHGSVDYGFDEIFAYDKRWDEISDSLGIENLDREVIKRLEDDLDALEDNRTFDSEDLEKASKLYYPAGMALYMAGAEFVQQDRGTARQMFVMAQDALRRVPNFTANKYKAVYLEGQSLTRLGQFREAIDPLMSIAAERFKKKKYPAEYILANDARVKLGYCYSLIDNYDQSVYWFNEVDEETESHKDALLGLAWTHYRWEKYTLVDSLTQLIIDEYPGAPIYYEAVSLAGYNREMVGDHERAMNAYKAMIDQLENIPDIRNFVNERQNIAQQILEARQLETEIVESDNPDLFIEYVDVTNELDRLYRSVKLAEIVSLNPVMEEFIRERDSIRTVYRELLALQDSVRNSDDPDKMSGQFKRQIDRVEKVYAALQMRGHQIISQEKTVSQRMAEIEQHNQMTDDLTRKASTSRTEVVADLEEVRQLSKQLEQRNAAIDQWMSLEMAKLELMDAKQQYEQQLVSLSENRMAEITVDIDSWRQFAIRRYALEGLDFDALLEQMQQLEDLNDRIQAIQEIIEEKSGADDETRRPPSLEELEQEGADEETPEQPEGE